MYSTANVGNSTRHIPTLGNQNKTMSNHYSTLMLPSEKKPMQTLQNFYTGHTSSLKNLPKKTIVKNHYRSQLRVHSIFDTFNN